ncbi:MAG TPA: glycoside hydrolase family 3 N-terminal domain-containing protein [Kineosporiaceae bacterium]|nr:glycoside hydrolase family 3 N-terminal domain-containing protein [Kineosporiaceae bacterium]
MPGNIARGVGAAVATVAVTAAVVAAGTGAMVVYRSGTAGSPPSRQSGYAAPRATPTADALTVAPSSSAWIDSTPSPSPAAPATTRPADTRLSVRGPFRCPAVNSLTVKQALMQTLLIGVSGANTTGPSGLTDGPTPVGGIVVYDSSGLTAFRSGVLKRIAGQSPPPLVAVDDEGGRVQRVEALFGQLPSAQQQDRMDPAKLRTLAAQRARQLASVGVTLNLAPVLDLAGPTPGDRAYGSSPADVTAHAGAFAAGMRDAGVLPAFTHFPGYGHLTGDPEHGIAQTPPLSALRASDLVPFRDLATAGPSAVVVGNVYVPGVSSRAGLPATLDPAVYTFLRSDLGFRGLVITSELSQQDAIQRQYGTSKATVAALAAGADLVMLYHPGYLENLLADLSAAVASGQLPEARVRAAAAHVLAAKGCR